MANDDNSFKILASLFVNAFKGISYLNLGDEKKYQEYFKKNEYNRNIIFNDKALEFFNANSKGYKLSQSDLDGYKSIIHQLDATYFAYKMNYTEALKSYNKLLKLKNDPFSLKEQALINIPMIYSIQGDFKKSKNSKTKIKN